MQNNSEYGYFSPSDISLDGSALAVCWFESNYLKLNTNRCQLAISGNNF